MVNKGTRIFIEGDSVINEKQIAKFFATFDLSNPEDISMSTRQVDKGLCKEYRNDFRSDEAEFEDYAYSIQDKLIAMIAGNK